jgi:alkaline phosphatase D
MSSLQLANIVLNVDQWDGYADARKRLLSIVSDNKIENFVVLTGDIHSAGAGVLTVDGTPATAAVGVEFVGTSITSKGLTDIVPGGSEFLKPENLPGIAYLNLKDHGYTRCIVTPTSWVTDYVMVESTATDDSPTRVDASFTVAPGNPTLTRQ